MLGIEKKKTAFLYCIADGQFGTIKIDQKRLVIGNSHNADINLDGEWIGSKLAIAGRSSANGFYFQSVSDKHIWINGVYRDANTHLELRDRDCILIMNKEFSNWLILWFRLNIEEIETKWTKVSYSEAARLLPMKWHQHDKKWYICPQFIDNRVFVNKQIITDTTEISLGTTVKTESICGIFTPGCFYYEALAAQSADEFNAEPGQVTSFGRGTLSIDINERTVGSFFKKRTILRDIHIDICSGQMVLILGGSGAGKSTFMNAVIGYEKASGSITYEGRPLDDLRKNENAIGFVPQDNIVREGDTVGNAIRNAAQMKLPETIQRDPAEFNRRIQHTLEIMGLKEKEKSMISKLSGGEKKRVNVAAEYIGNPLLFFLDEPDTGVDPAQDEIMMRSLRSIADEGKIVMMITHTPDRGIDYYDKVIVIAKNREKQCGELAFFGTKEKAWSFFERHSFEEIVKVLNDEKEDHSSAYVRKYQKLNPGREGIQ